MLPTYLVWTYCSKFKGKFDQGELSTTKMRNASKEGYVRITRNGFAKIALMHVDGLIS